MAAQRQVGRNDPCSCGSGKKFKQCCASKAGRWTRGQVALLTLLAVVFVSGLVLAVNSRQEHRGQPTGVWDEAHGHYH
jgi:hypothetical protein